MKFGFIVVAIVILSALAAQIIFVDTGYVAIHIRGWTITTSVTKFGPLAELGTAETVAATTASAVDLRMVLQVMVVPLC